MSSPNEILCQSRKIASDAYRAPPEGLRSHSGLDCPGNGIARPYLTISFIDGAQHSQRRCIRMKSGKISLQINSSDSILSLLIDRL